MVGLRAHEICHFCNHKIALENERSMFDHYEECHRQEMDTVLVSNNMKDCIKTACKLCDIVYPVVRMRTHVRVKHDMTIGEYKQRFDIATDRDYDLIRKVLHKCGICGIYIALCADVVATHCKRHKISHGEYNKQYMEMVCSPKDKEPDEKIKKPRKRKIKEDSLNEVSVPFDPSMILTGDELNLNLFTPIYSEESDDNISNSLDFDSNSFQSELEGIRLPCEKLPLDQKRSKLEDNKISIPKASKRRPVSKVQLGDPSKLENLMDKIMGHYAFGASQHTLEENVSLDFDQIVSNVWEEC